MSDSKGTVLSLFSILFFPLRKRENKTGNHSDIFVIPRKTLTSQNINAQLLMDNSPRNGKKGKYYPTQRSLLLGCLVYKYRFSLPSVGQREMGTTYRIAILLSLILLFLCCLPKKNILLNIFAFLNEIHHILDLFIQDKKLN